MIKKLGWIFFFATLAALEIEVGKESLFVELATTSEERRIGLSGRKEVPEGTGMLFIFEAPQIAHFWMKDTLVPLSIGFFTANRILVDWKEMEIPSKESDSLPIYSSSCPVSYALEVPKGWFSNHCIKLGAELKVLKGENPSQDRSDPVE